MVCLTATCLRKYSFLTPGYSSYTESIPFKADFYFSKFVVQHSCVIVQGTFTTCSVSLMFLWDLELLYCVLVACLPVGFLCKSRCPLSPHGQVEWFLLLTHFGAGHLCRSWRGRPFRCTRLPLYFWSSSNHGKCDHHIQTEIGLPIKCCNTPFVDLKKCRTLLWQRAHITIRSDLVIKWKSERSQAKVSNEHKRKAFEPSFLWY